MKQKKQFVKWSSFSHLNYGEILILLEVLVDVVAKFFVSLEMVFCFPSLLLGSYFMAVSDVTLLSGICTFPS